MQKRINVAVRAIMMVFCAALGFTTLTSCNQGGKVDGSAPAAEKNPVSDVKINIDTLTATFTVVGEPDAVGYIGVKATVDAGADHAIGEADKAITWEPVADMANEGLKYSRSFKSQYGHVVTTSATLDKATVDFGDYTGRVLLTGVELKPIAVSDNVELTPAEGERERMLTNVQAIWTGVVRIDGQRGEKAFELNPTDGVIRWIAEDAPTIDHYEITPSENRVLTGWNGDVLITAVMSDDSKVEVGNDPVFVGESWVCTSNWSVTVSKAEQTTGKLNKISSTSDSFRKDGVRGYYTGKYITETWESLVNVNGKQVKNVFVAKYVSNVEYHMFDRDEKATFTNAASSATIDAGTITNNSLYSAIGTNVVGTVSRTATAPGTITVNKTLVDVKAEMSRDWTSSNGTWTWKLTEYYSDNSKVTLEPITWSKARSISANYFEVEDEAKALSSGSVQTEVSHSGIKKDEKTNYTVRYKEANATYKWTNTFVEKSTTSIITSVVPEAVTLEYKGYTFVQPTDEVQFNRGNGTLNEINSTNEDVTVYWYECPVTEKIAGFNNSSATATATGKLFINGGHGGGEPEYPEYLKGVINGNIVAPDQDNASTNWYVTYLLDFGTYVRPIAIDKNGNFVQVNGQPFGEKFNKDTRWNGGAIINGQLVPVKGDDLGWGARYSHSSRLSLVRNYTDLSNGFNWDHSTIKNVTNHFLPTVKKENGMVVVTFDGAGTLTFAESL